jgi:hypothetical protein
VANSSLTRHPIYRRFAQRDLHIRGVNMSRLRTPSEFAMDANLDGPGASGLGAPPAGRCHGLVLAVIAAGLIHLSAGSDATPRVEPWPALLSDALVDVDPGIAALQLRAHGSLDRLVEAGRVADPPL